MTSPYIANVSAGASPAYSNPSLAGAQGHATNSSATSAQVSRVAAAHAETKVLSAEKSPSIEEKRPEPGFEDSEAKERDSSSEESEPRGPDGRRNLTVA